MFGRGGADCLGCNSSRYYVVYDTLTRRAQLEHTWLHDAPERESGVQYWDFPGKTAIWLYADIDTLIAATRDARWWHRSHAVRVLRMVLGPATKPWPEPDSLTQARFTDLKLGSVAHRRVAYNALIDRLADTDPDVASFALRYLRELTGQKFGRSTASVAEWRRWLDTTP